MDTPTLLILGSRKDFHVECVAKLLEQQGDIAVVILDYLADVQFSLEVSHEGVVSFRVNGRRLPERYLVWDRRKIRLGLPLYVRGEGAAAAYAAQEWRGLFTLVSGLQVDRVVNSLESKRCNLKPYQQMIAASVGFLVPPTLITTDKQGALEFMAVQGGTIMKSLAQNSVSASGEEGTIRDYNIMTTRVSKEDLETADAAEIAYCPHFFQQEVKKSHELRVVVIGDQLFAFRVDSQKYKFSEVDSRNGFKWLDFEPCTLDDDIRARTFAFMNKMGLFTGSLDYIVDVDGRTWFLEVNESGVWEWLDRIVNGAIGRAFADVFTIRARTIANGT